MTTDATLPLPAAEHDDERKTRTAVVYYYAPPGRPPQLTALMCEPDHLGHQFEHHTRATLLGTVTAPRGVMLLDMKARVWERYGGHDGGSGPPAFVDASYLIDDSDDIAGQVAVVLLTWPRYAPPGHAGGPTAEAIADAVDSYVERVEWAMAALGRGVEAAAA